MREVGRGRLRIIRWFCWLALLIILLVLGRAVFHIVWHLDADNGPLIKVLAGHLDDASRLNETAIAGREVFGSELLPSEQALLDWLQRARDEGLKVSIAGSRHTMGGHTLYPGGVVLDMGSHNQMELEASRNILHVQTGARWREVVSYLDRHNRSVKVMQSNNSFTIGGSVSANCHGWQYGMPPISSTVESFRILLSDGSIRTCSRDENQELFSLALGGYGLFGIILDVRLHVVENEAYRMEQFVVPTDVALDTFDREIRGKQGLEMLYARMNVAEESFLEEVMISAFFKSDEPNIPKLTEPGMKKLRRAIFRGSARSNYGKALRWQAETIIQPIVRPKVFSRNQLLNEAVEVFQNRNPQTTDILHEYFLPRERAVAFIQDVKRIIPAAKKSNLLNVTVRAVGEDTDTWLRYADQAMLAFVMLFVQERTEAGELQMKQLTQALIEAALSHEGRYYLPYRLHASPEQFHRAYPQAKAFFEKKHEYDPYGLFQNTFYLRYGGVKK